ncbi:multidrug resistance-associated protein 1 [Aplysia californica]|uniref:ABC-type glutathione-S-conjugate transporter n=1 Tax=Aplysia californica TaxID=6500 RepID=A0ABM0JL63_APLCA|nr:multidrug resistance-associated protein 1 [Aplysia californica]XP_005096297.1 multidrug resistance-associated protein 1 [Aplysia californica]
MSDPDSFCGGTPFWDGDLLLNSSYPHFTECFKDTALVWGPCAVLWVSTPLYLYYMSGQKTGRKVPVTTLGILKTLIALLLAVVCVANILDLATGSAPVLTLKYVSWGVRAGTFLLVVALIQAERYYGFITSGVLFMVFLLFVVTGIVPLYSNIIEEYDKTSMFQFTSYFIYFALVLLEFLLLFKSDRIRRSGYRNLGKRPVCPETKASFPSQVVYFWIISLLRKGYKKTLLEDDVFQLNPRDKSANVIPHFESCWQKEMNRCKAVNSERRRQSLYSSGYHKVHRTSSGNVNEKSSLLGNDSVEFRKDRDENVKLATPSLPKVILKVFGGMILASQLLKLLSDLLTFVTPLLINELISFTQNRENEQEWKGYVLAFSFFLIAMCKTCLYQYHFHISMTLGMRIKNAVIASVYKKALTISNEAKKESTVGEIVNLMSVDCQRIQDATGYIYMAWSMPLMIVLAMYMLWGTLGAASMAGLGVLILLMPINAWAAYMQRGYQTRQMKVKDKRIKIMNEVLNGMKVLKLYAWEESFQKKITDIRNEELSILKKTAYLVAVTTFVWTCAPYVVQLASFGTYIAISDSGYLDPSTAFVSFSLFAILNQPMTFLPMIIPFLIQAGVSIGRVSKFLRSDDLKPDVVQRDPNSDAAVKVENGTFTWDMSMPLPTLRKINIRVPEGQLVAVVGTVGSGKSSLLSAMLGEMRKMEGRVTIKNSIAYVPQEAWIQNATLKDNILFGKEHSSSQYKNIINACALQPDLEILPGGDSTEIGEKGINLSGGQKQRVSLARAVYSGADTYLLDDPLSAVDSHVGKHIFNEVVGKKGILQNKTRILVTHGIHWLPMVDHIIVMNNGQVSEEGSYDELMSHAGAFANFLQEFFIKEHHADSDSDEGEEEDPEIERMKAEVFQRLESVTSDGATSADERKSKSKRHSDSESGANTSRQASYRRSLGKSVEKKKEAPKAGQKLIEEEKSETGNVSMNVYFEYVKAVGVLTFVIMTLTYLFFQASNTGSALWLSEWTDDELLANSSASGTSEFIDRNNMYLAVYGILGVAQSIFVLTFALIASTRMVKAAGKLHLALLDNILKAPMSFYDTTPIGRILNRFSRDVETIDNNLPSSIRSFYNCIFSVTGTIVTISYSTPIFLAVVVPLGIMYWMIQRFYIPTSRQLKRIESTTRSPIYVHFSETVGGAASIRAYGASERFVMESRNRVDHNLSFYFASLASNRWLGWSLECIGNLIILSAALFAVLSTDLEPGLVGLSVSYSTQVTGALNYLVRMFSELETNIVSVERLKEYAETPTENAWVIPYNRPDSQWPQRGDVSFNNYQTRYRPGLELVLKGVSCRIQGKEKVGIVGRTGAGKSSLTVALFRLIESAAGSITIDNINISEIGLHDLRSKLTILPQDPVIFSGTLRMNLDPFDEFSDATLWSALENAHLKSFVETLPTGLNYECGESGQNLSVGQRQLVCLARTLVRKTQILILDEATAAVDMETDELIQKTIRTEFSECTVLTIAHRLNTIVDYDKILVLDKGRVSEFDSPKALLDNKSSIFYGMAKDAGLV